MKPKVVTIVGPTGSGKTALSLKLAERFSGEIISADSRQVYRGLDIGTEKITPEEMQSIPHHLIDVADPMSVYTAADFKCDALIAIKEIQHRGHLPIVAGGTYFYIDVLLDRISLPEVEPDSTYRDALEQLETDELVKRLRELDTERAATIDTNNRRRLIRAIEVATALGVVPKQLQRECLYDVLALGIDIDKTILRERLEVRAKAALERGLIKETEKLIEQGVTKKRLQEIGLEYRLVIEYLEGTYNEVTLLQKLTEKNWQYAKRQLTWLKRDSTIQWLPGPDTDTARQLVDEFLQP